MSRFVLIQQLKGLIRVGGIALFILGAVFLHSAISQENSQIFCDPAIQGYRLDWCLHWADQCGEPAATTWCRTKGYERATQWNEAVDIGSSSATYVIGDARVCDLQFCDGFSMIECTGATTSSTPSGAPKRTILPNGTVEIRYPDGTIKHLSIGLPPKPCPNCIQAPDLIPPSPLSDDFIANSWLATKIQLITTFSPKAV